MKYQKLIIIFLVSLFLVVFCVCGVLYAQEEQITLKFWCHWASEKAKREFTEKAIEAFEKANPNIKIEMTWYEKNQLFQVLRAEMSVGSGKPDLFYLDPKPDPRYGGSPWVNEGLVADITEYLDKNSYNEEDLKAWTYNNRLYGLPLEGGLFMIYVNRGIFEKAGVQFPPANGRNFTQEEFKDAVIKIRDAGYVPLAAGVMESVSGMSTDCFISSCLVRELGKEGFEGLIRGKISWKDPRVLNALRYVSELTKLRTWPDDVLSMRFADGFLMFSQGVAAMYADGPWMFSRAANPVEQGGLPGDFKLDVMDFPAKISGEYNDVGVKIVAGSWVVSAQSKHIPEAASFLRFISTPEWAKEWVKIVKGQTGINGWENLKEMNPILGKAQRLQNQGEMMIPGICSYLLTGNLAETWLETASKALIAGQMSPQEVIDSMLKYAQ